MGSDEEQPEADVPSERDSDAPEHRLMLGKRWGERAEANVEEWGNQRHDTLLLALIEEVGEIALAMQADTAPGQHPPPDSDEDNRAERGRELIRRMADLGRDTREFLEAEYPAPAGDPSVTESGEIVVHGQPVHITPIIDEVEDAAPLLWQLYWALQEANNAE